MNKYIPIKKNSAGEEFFETPYLEARVMAAQQVLVYKWKGYVKDEEAMTGIKELLEMVKRSKVVNLLADLTAFEGGSVETSKWIDRVWSVQLKEAGIKKLAVVVPNNTVGELISNVALGPTAVSVLKAKIFYHPEEVYPWFKSES